MEKGECIQEIVTTWFNKKPAIRREQSSSHRRDSRELSSHLDLQQINPIRHVPLSQLSPSSNSNTEIICPDATSQCELFSFISERGFSKLVFRFMPFNIDLLFSRWFYLGLLSHWRGGRLLGRMDNLEWEFSIQIGLLSRSYSLLSKALQMWFTCFQTWPLDIWNDSFTEKTIIDDKACKEISPFHCSIVLNDNSMSR